MTITIKHTVDIIRELPDLIFPDLTFMVIPENEGFSAVCSTQSIITQGNDLEELLKNIEEAVECHITN